MANQHRNPLIVLTVVALGATCAALRLAAQEPGLAPAMDPVIEGIG